MYGWIDVKAKVVDDYKKNSETSYTQQESCTYELSIIMIKYVSSSQTKSYCDYREMAMESHP